MNAFTPIDTPVTDTPVDTPVDGPPAVIYVGSMGGDTVTLDYVPERTAREYLDQAGVSVGGGQVPTINAEPADLDLPPQPNSVLLVASRISNG